MIKITYYDLKGLAELIRILLKFRGEEFEDERITFEDWPTLKPSTPFGSLPMLTLDDGQQFAQSTSIARYFATKFNLRGATPEEVLHADMIVDLVRVDIFPLFGKLFHEEDESKKKELLEDARSKTYPWMAMVNDTFIKGSGTVLASGLSWADFALFNVVEDLLPVSDSKVDEKLTKVHEVVNKVKNDPKLKEWLDSRHHTPI